MATHALLAGDGSFCTPDGPVHTPRLHAVQGPPPGPADAQAPARQPLSFNALVAITVVVLHLLVFAALIAQRQLLKPAPEPVAIQLLAIPAAPPPPPSAAPEQLLDTPPVVVPPPVLLLEERPPTITAVVSEAPPAPQPAAPAPAAVAEGPPSPAAARSPSTVSGGDLSAGMVEASPPRYPYESRRLKEQGTVVLDVLLGPDGRVERIGLRSSSGYPRLDQAALEAVRHWRWSPMVRDGRAVSVRGLVEIPFALTPAR